MAETGRWLEKPWVVANCVDDEEDHLFETRAEAEQWVRRQTILGELILYPDSHYRILSAAQVRSIEAVGATIYDDFAESCRRL